MIDVSYDVAIYTRQTMGSADLSALIHAVAGLDVDAAVERSLSVARGARRRYSFTVDGPYRLEAEDVPPEVVTAVLDARWLWSVMVEGSEATEIPHAVRFARRLAKALDGAVYDQQTDEVWSRSRSRSVQKPTRDQRVSKVRFDWLCQRKSVTPDVGRLYLDVVSRVLPEALPRRFGEYEPFQGKYAESGAEGFCQAWRNATGLLFFSGSGPVVGGTLSAGPSESNRGNFWTMSLTLHADPLRQEAWRHGLRSTFVELADGLPAFYASAQVTRGHIWSGRSSWSDNQTEWAMTPLRHRVGWTGLPPIPMWWTWFGAPYAEKAMRLPAARSTMTRSGVLFETSEQPLPRDALEPLDAWLPPAFFAKLAPNPRSAIPAPLQRAEWVPDQLQ